MYAFWLINFPLTSSLFYFYFCLALISLESFSYCAALYLLSCLKSFCRKANHILVNVSVILSYLLYFILHHPFKPVPVIPGSDHVSSPFLWPIYLSLNAQHLFSSSDLFCFPPQLWFEVSSACPGNTLTPSEHLHWVFCAVTLSLYGSERTRHRHQVFSFQYNPFENSSLLGQHRVLREQLKWGAQDKKTGWVSKMSSIFLFFPELYCCHKK